MPVRSQFRNARHDRAPRPDTRSYGGVFRALRYRNYRLFFAGQSISVIGTWLQMVALSWLVYRLTHSALLLGVTGFAGQIPAVLIGPFCGVMIDRWNRHRILMVTQSLALLQAAALATMVYTHHASILWIMLLSAFMGVVNAFDMPARQAFVIQMVEDRTDLPNAIALNSSMFNGARLIGPSVAGILLASVGEGMCFLLNAISYLAVIAALAAMRVRSTTDSRPKQRVLVELREGLSYAAHFAPIRNLLTLLALLCLVAMPYNVLMPVFAASILHGGAVTLGFLTTATGIGALAAALYLASRKSVLGLTRVILVGVTLFGFGLLVFSRSHVLWLSMIMLSVAGFGMMLHLASTNTVLQTVVDEDKRGRVMSLHSMSFMGTAPFGSLLAGVMAHRFGAPNTIFFSGLCCLAAGLAFARHLPTLRAAIRPVYIRAGIIEEAADIMPAPVDLDESLEMT